VPETINEAVQVVVSPGANVDLSQVYPNAAVFVIEGVIVAPPVFVIVKVHEVPSADTDCEIEAAILIMVAVVTVAVTDEESRGSVPDTVMVSVKLLDPEVTLSMQVSFAFAAKLVPAIKGEVGVHEVVEQHKIVPPALEVIVIPLTAVGPLVILKGMSTEEPE